MCKLKRYDVGELKVCYNKMLRLSLGNVQGSKILVNGPMNMGISKINYKCTHEPITSP
jgi:hypothetical protein